MAENGDDPSASLRSAAPLSGEPVRRGCPEQHHTPYLVVGAAISAARGRALRAPTSGLEADSGKGHPSGAARQLPSRGAEFSAGRFFF